MSSPISQDSPEKVLILALSGIGNFIMQSPVFAQIKKMYPECEVTVWVAPRGTKALAEVNEHIDHVIESPIKMSVVEHFGHMLSLSKKKFDTGIMLYPGQLWKGAGYLYLANIARRIGHNYKLGSDTASKFLLTDTALPQNNLHDVDQNLKLLALLDSEYLASISRYSLKIPQDNLEKAKELVVPYIDIWTNKKLIGIHLGSASNMKFKRWPIDRFIKIAKKLVDDKDVHVLVFGGPDEVDLKNEVKATLGGSATVIDTDLVTTAGVMKKCNLFLSNDSGLMHLAAAVGVKTYGLFGPTDENKTGPRGSDSHVIRATDTKPDYDVSKIKSYNSEAYPSILKITPELVLSKIADSL